MRRKSLAYLVILGSMVLLILSINEIDFHNLSHGPYATIIGSFLMILSMIVTLRKIKEKERSK